MKPGPPKQFDRDQALERAMEVFWERGFDATHLSELLEHMGIGRQSLYDTFGDKRALFLEALAAYCERMGAPIIAVLERPGSALANLREMLELLRERAESSGGRGCFLGNSCAQLGESDPEVEQLVQASLGRVEDALAVAFAAALDAGELSNGAAPRDLARLVLSLAQGLALVSRTPLGASYVESSLSALASLLPGDVR